jgi:hypothetical protein
LPPLEQEKIWHMDDIPMSTNSGSVCRVSISFNLQE